MEYEDSRRGLDHSSPGSSVFQRRKKSLLGLRRTPGQNISPSYYLRNSSYKYSRGGTSISAGSSHSVGDELLENLNSALRALGSTPSKVCLKSPISPIPVMQSLEDDTRETGPVYSTPRAEARSVSLRSPCADVAPPDSAKKLMDLQQKHSSLLNECAELETQVLKAEKRRETLHGQLVELDSDVKNMKQEKQRLESDIKDLESCEEVKKKDLDALGDVVKEREARLYDVEREIREARDRLGETESHIEHAQREKCSIESSIEVLEKQMEEARARLDDMENEIEKKKAMVEDLTLKYNGLQESVMEATSRKDELNQAAQKAEDKIRDAEETVRKLEGLTSEGCFLVEDQSHKAAIAQEEWERAEQRLGEIQSEIVESSARLEAKRSMLREMDRSLAPYVQAVEGGGVADCSHIVQDIEKQRVLLNELERANTLKFEEAIALGKHIESLKQQRGQVLLGKGASTDERVRNSSESSVPAPNDDEKVEDHNLIEENSSLKRSLQEALHEIEKLSHLQQNIHMSEIMEKRLRERERQLEKAMSAVNLIIQKTEAVERRADDAENAYARMKSKYEAPHGIHVRNQGHAQSDIDSDVSSIEGKTLEKENDHAEMNVAGGLVERLRREKLEALERIHRLTGETDFIPSGLRKDILRRRMNRFVLHHEQNKGNAHQGFAMNATSQIPAVHQPLTAAIDMNQVM